MLRVINFWVILITVSPVFYFALPAVSMLDDMFLMVILTLTSLIKIVNLLNTTITKTRIIIFLYILACCFVYKLSVVTVIGLLYLFKFPLIIICFMALVPRGDHRKQIAIFFKSILVIAVMLNLFFLIAQPYLISFGYDQQYGGFYRNMGFFPNAQRNSFVICLALVGLSYYFKERHRLTYFFLTIANFLTYSKKDQVIHLLILRGKTNLFFQILFSLPIIFAVGVMVYLEYADLKVSDTIRGLLWLIPIQNFSTWEWYFGWGPGLWGGHVSTIFYSDLYFEFGLASLWGASPDHYTFLSDGYWPHVLGEVGLIGICINLLLLNRIRSSIISINDKDHVKGLLVLFYLLGVYSLFMSSFEINIMLVPVAFLVALSAKNIGHDNENCDSLPR